MFFGISPFRNSSLDIIKTELTIIVLNFVDRVWLVTTWSGDMGMRSTKICPPGYPPYGDPGCVRQKRISAVAQSSGVSPLLQPKRSAFQTHTSTSLTNVRLKCDDFRFQYSGLDNLHQRGFPQPRGKRVAHQDLCQLAIDPLSFVQSIRWYQMNPNKQ